MANNTTFFGTTINESATIIRPAAAAIDGAQGIALALGATGLTKPSAGDPVIGLSLFTNDDGVAEGAELTVQVKDIGKWIAAEAFAAGALLATDANGKAVAAKSGDFIVAQALTASTASGDVVTVQIIKAGYAA